MGKGRSGVYCSHHGKAFSFINIPFSCICYSFPQVCFVSLILCDLNEWPEWDIFKRFKFSFYCVEHFELDRICESCSREGQIIIKKVSVCFFCLFFSVSLSCSMFILNCNNDQKR